MMKPLSSRQNGNIKKFFRFISRPSKKLAFDIRKSKNSLSYTDDQKNALQFILLSINQKQSLVMENIMQKVLREFYCNVVRTHKQASQKIQALDRFFSRFHIFSERRTDFLKQNKESEQGTLASIGDIQPSYFKPPRSNSISTSMLYTFLLSNEAPSVNNQEQTCQKVISQTAFTDFSFYKVLLYAVFVNFLHINKQTNFAQENNILSGCKSLAQNTLKKVKIAMVSAAQAFKVKDKKKYTKIRYLYDQLINYSQRAIHSSEDYIKVIIEEFNDDFIDKTFDILKSKNSQLLYSKSLCSSGSLVQDSLRVDGFLHEIERALEYLKIKVVLTRKVQTLDLGSDQLLNIVIEEIPMPNEAFKLKQIISMRKPQECFFQ